jgi:hypothetical protein
MDKKKQLIEELKKQTKLAKERLGPDGVKELEQLAKNLSAKKKAQPSAPEMVPYDKASALKAFQLFLANHGDPKEFERRLLEMIKKKSH